MAPVHDPTRAERDWTLQQTKALDTAARRIVAGYQAWQRGEIPWARQPHPTAEQVHRAEADALLTKARRYDGLDRRLAAGYTQRAHQLLADLDAASRKDDPR